MWFDNLRTRSKIFIIVGVAFVGTVFIALWALSSINDELVGGRRLKVQQLTEAAVSLVAGYEADVKAGRLSEEDAKRAALADLKRMRYGEGDYFWINDMTPTMVMHPTKPELDGKPLADMKTPTGNKLFIEMIEIVKQSGAGFYFYYWPKPGASEPVRKLSYIKGFAPWGWVIGTGIYIDDVEAAARQKALLFGGIVLFVTLLVVLISLVVSRRLTQPLHQLTDDMGLLAKGDLNFVVDGDSRRDEVGEMSRALIVFREAEINRRKLEAEQARERAEKDERNRRVDLLTREFQESAQSVLASVGNAAHELRDVARVMTDVANDSHSQTSIVSTSAEQADMNVQTVASAAEQLAAAEAEIAQQIALSTQIAQNAAVDAERITGIVAGLADATRQIGDIVGLINDIATQTNLLALNATIEAARAGEAGKGFAVVANEVKNLANQTASATNDITAQIAAVQGATDGAVAAISGIGQTIAQINQSSTAIAAAVEEQTAATREIARNVQEASQGTRTVTDNVTKVQEGVTRTAATAEQVLSTADHLIDRSTELADGVAQFLNRLRA